MQENIRYLALNFLPSTANSSLGRRYQYKPSKLEYIYLIHFGERHNYIQYIIQ